MNYNYNYKWVQKKYITLLKPFITILVRKFHLSAINSKPQI